MIVLRAPLNEGDIKGLQTGDEVWLEGTIYAARDAAHKNIVDTIHKGGVLPFDLEGQMIYYVGPCPAPPGKAIGAAGPTTSGRMDAYAPILIEQGLKAMIGKGDRSPEVISAMKKHGAVYLAAVGGAGAYLAGKIERVDTIAYPELGPEAVFKMTVRNFPCIVAIDCRGKNIYDLN